MTTGRTLVVALLLLAAVAPVYASTLESATTGGVAYQFDGETHHDAPDACATAADAWSLPMAGSADGALMAPDDVSDVFVLDVPSSLLGQRIEIELAEATDFEDLEFNAFVPGCGPSIFDLVNWPAPEPSPTAPAAGETQTSADVTQPRFCFSDQWVFHADRLSGISAPASIHVAWTDGTERAVPLAYKYGQHAFYATNHGLEFLLKGAWINLPSTWTGAFTLAAGPCDAVDGGAIYGPAPVAGMGTLSFTPIHVGQFTVQVTYGGVAGQFLRPIPALASVDPAALLPVVASDFVHDHDDGSHSHGAGPSVLPASPGVPGPIVIPATCHFCARDIEEVWELLSYRLSASAS